MGISKVLKIVYNYLYNPSGQLDINFQFIMMMKLNHICNNLWTTNQKYFMNNYLN